MFDKICVAMEWVCVAIVVWAALVQLGIIK